MFDDLAFLLEQSGPFAPILYICFFLATALLPFIPTPLVSALGGSFLGIVPAIVFGVVGLGLGAALALTLARRLGYPLVIRLIGKKNWHEWEDFLGIRSVPVWGVIFFVLNIDFAVMLSGLTDLPLWRLWSAAMIARLPWLLVSVWFGESLFRSEQVWMRLLAGIAIVFVLLKIVRGIVRQKVLGRVAPTPTVEVASTPSED
jgi:uncharacterized membrane protein YdjX (TVP38/TMEM64 family)